jgi:CO/xanthine dehydrogenase Mo-binding subunit
VAALAYRAVFLRVHPTGKMVLSLTTESDGNEAKYAQLVAEELGVPALDVKVVPADESRFGTGHGFNTTPSTGTSAAITSATGKIRDKAQLLAGAALQAPPCTPTGPASSPRASRAASTPRPCTAINPERPAAWLRPRSSPRRAP